MIESTLSPTVCAVIDTYPEELRTLLLDVYPDESMPKLPASESKCKESKRKAAIKSPRKTARRRASISARLNSYVRDYSADLQDLFDDIVAATQSENSDNSNCDSASVTHKTDQPKKDNLADNLAVYGAQYLKERLTLMQKRSRISVLPLLKKCKKTNMKRRSRASLIDKLEILRKQFQLLKKNDPSVKEPKRNYLSKISKLKSMKKIGKMASKGKAKRKTKIRTRAKRINRQKTKKTSRKSNAANQRIPRRQAILG